MKHETNEARARTLFPISSAWLLHYLLTYEFYLLTKQKISAQLSRPQQRCGGPAARSAGRPQPGRHRVLDLPEYPLRRVHPHAGAVEHVHQPHLAAVAVHRVRDAALGPDLDPDGDHEGLHRHGLDSVLPRFRGGCFRKAFPLPAPLHSPLLDLLPIVHFSSYGVAWVFRGGKRRLGILLLYMINLEDSKLLLRCLGRRIKELSH